MKYYAKVKHGIVENVIIADMDHINRFEDSSALWVETDPNTRCNIHYGPDGTPDGGTPIRANYAGVGSIYDPVNDVFLTKKPFNSWILDTEHWIWVPPVGIPTDGQTYRWNEPTKSWVPFESGVTSSDSLI